MRQFDEEPFENLAPLLWRTALPIADTTAAGRLVASLPILAAADPEALFLPRKAAEAFDRFDPSLAIRHICDQIRAKTRQVTADKVPSRNDPCTCGSGKKWKKCHGT